MVNRFKLLRTPKIIFGEGQAHSLPGIFKSPDRHLLIITGSGSHRENVEISNVLSALVESGYNLSFESIANEPSPADIDKITARHRESSPEIVVAIGGGSAIDAGKAVSAMLTVEGSVKDYLEGVGTKMHSGKKKFFVAVPTTSGTGSEATSNAVISETGINGFKRSLRHEKFVPDVALVDPLLTVSCPGNITASSGMDAFTQLVESYLSVKSGPITDALALDGIAKIKFGLARAVNNGKDIEARSAMAYAALLSGITLANAGLGLVHGFASSIGGFFDIPHGVVCGTMMSVVNRYNIEKLLLQHEISSTHSKYAMLGKIFSGRNDLDLKGYMKFTADYLDNLTEKLGLKRIGEYGIDENDLEHIASVTDHKSNPVIFEKSELVEMLSKRL